MKVLFLDQFSELGGAQRALLELLPALAERKWGACVAAPGGGPLHEQAARLGASTARLPVGFYGLGRKASRDYLRFLADQPLLATYIRRLGAREGVDLIYVNGPRVALAAAIAARGRKPVVFHCHSRIHPRGASAAVAVALRWASAKSLACSEFAAAPLRRKGCEIRTVYYGVPELWRLRPARSGEWRIGLIGRISPEKGQLDFLAAARMIADQIPACRFLIAGAPLFSTRSGEDYAHRVQQAAARLPVELTGWQADVADMLARLDLLVVPSAGEEATPRVILEAYAAGVPVVAYRAGGIPEVVEEGRTGFLVEPRPEALAERITALVRAGRGALAELGAAARRLWRERFNVERYQSEVISLLEAFHQHPKKQS